MLALNLLGIPLMLYIDSGTCERQIKYYIVPCTVHVLVLQGRLGLGRSVLFPLVEMVTQCAISWCCCNDWVNECTSQREERDKSLARLYVRTGKNFTRVVTLPQSSLTKFLCHLFLLTLQMVDSKVVLVS